jgi:hypothetical protein
VVKARISGSLPSIILTSRSKQSTSSKASKRYDTDIKDNSD